MLPAWTLKWGMKPYWMLFFVCLWMAMPRYRIESNDRVRLVYLDKNGDAKHPPLTQYLINTLIPEEEIVNFGIRNLMIARPVISMMGVGGTLIAQANQDIANDKIHNFFTPYDSSSVRFSIPILSINVYSSFFLVMTNLRSFPSTSHKR